MAIHAIKMAHEYVQMKIKRGCQNKFYLNKNIVI